MPEFYSVLNPPQPSKLPQFWGKLYEASNALAISKLSGFNLIIANSITDAIKLKAQLHFFTNAVILDFPSLETLPYDSMSPHQDIISKRLATLYQLPDYKKGFLITTVDTVLQRLIPINYIKNNALIFHQNTTIDFSQLIQKLNTANYHRVEQVMEHGEFSVRGSILDLFPMGEKQPFRLDFFDNEIESIKKFDPKTQLSTQAINKIQILPASETPLNKTAINIFKNNWQNYFQNEENTGFDSVIYQSIINKICPAGIESYLPLFFEQTQTIFDYLPNNTTIISSDGIANSIKNYTEEYQKRYQETTELALRTTDLILSKEEFFKYCKSFQQIKTQVFAISNKSYAINFNSQSSPPVAINHKLAEPMMHLLNFIKNNKTRILFVAESPGRREILHNMLIARKISIKIDQNFIEFNKNNHKYGITVGDLSVNLNIPDFCIITEAQLFGEHIKQRKIQKRTQKSSNKENIINSLVELKINNPVVHVDNGIGRYRGLKTLDTGGKTGEYLILEYANNDILYVPVESLNLIHKYTGASSENAPLHRLGSKQWDKAKQKAKQKAYDIAAELLEIYAKRKTATTKGALEPDEQYQLFAADFPFETTIDQQKAIKETLSDMQSSIPMDRLICGDVGFGKTEVAMRAAFLATQNNQQVAVLVPTTLLAGQHYQSFLDRFSAWATNIDMLSRFKSDKDTKEILQKITDGKIDIVIGTHKLLSKDIKFKNLGLLIIDEEHRFGVKQKEQFKSLRAEIDILTLTATPIPRTLNLSISGMRDLSIISTAPDNRIAIQTFVQSWDAKNIKEACHREINRGGQVYFLHNQVSNIEKITRDLQQLIPKANIQIAHGQMKKHQLETVMRDFYHRKIHILVCTTIIETGLDIPTANTIIINKADKLGLAQLYQIRGRVGRSHHKAYAYLIVDDLTTLSNNARKRLQAIESIKDLGTGFSLALEDMEIRGTGEILGDEQSGQINEIGFAMYSEILEQAVSDLKSTDEKQPVKLSSVEINLGSPALIPEDYISDINIRLVSYKKISSAHSFDDLQDIKVELIDRFGLLPEFAQNLFSHAELKLNIQNIGVKKILADDEQINIEFIEQPIINHQKLIELIHTQPAKYKLLGKDKIAIFGNFTIKSKNIAINECINFIKV